MGLIPTITNLDGTAPSPPDGGLAVSIAGEPPGGQNLLSNRTGYPQQMCGGSIRAAIQVGETRAWQRRNDLPECTGRAGRDGDKQSINIVCFPP